MVASFRESRPLLNELNTYPESWSLTPVRKDSQGKGKVPIRKGWNTEPRLGKLELINIITNNQQVTGVGLRTGEASGGLIAIDVDGQSAVPVLEAISKRDLPETITWTSGKTGRKQIAYILPLDYRLRAMGFQKKVIKTWGDISCGVDEDGKAEQLEVRYNFQQSVIPPSLYSTNRYEWIVSPDEHEVAIAPQWLIDIILRETEAKYSDAELIAFFNNHVLDKLDVEDVYTHDSHQWTSRNSKEWRGGCPFHDSSSNTAFQVSEYDLAWHCKNDDIGGGPLQYIYLVNQLADKPQEVKDAFLEQYHRDKSAVQITPTGADLQGVVSYLSKIADVEFPEALISSRNKANKVVPIERDRDFLSMDEVREQLQALYASSPTHTTVEIEIENLARAGGSTNYNIKQIYQAIGKDDEHDEVFEDATQRLNHVIDTDTLSVDFKNYVPQDLWPVFEHQVRFLKYKPEVMLMAFFATFSGVQKVGNRVETFSGSGFSQPTNLYSAVVSPSGNRKSPLSRSFITQALKPINEAINTKHDVQQQCYQDDLLAYKAGDTDDFSEPKEPVKKLINITHTNGEGLLYQIAKQQDQGLLYHRDEIQGLFGSSNQYRRGRGSDDEDLLQLYDADGLRILRSEGIKAEFEQSHLSIFGGIQDEVLRKRLEKGDHNGMYARFILVHQPLVEAELPEYGSKIPDTSGLLTRYYRYAYEHEPTTYTLNYKAYELFKTYYSSVEKRRISADAGVRAVWGKVAGQVLRIAANMHMMFCCTSGVESTEINESVMERAIHLMETLTKKTISFYRASSSDRDDRVTAEMATFLNAAKRMGGFNTISAIRKNVTQNRRTKNSKDAETIARKLAELGHGELTHEGKRLRFKAKNKTVTEGDGASQKCDIITPPSFEPIYIKKGDGYRDENVTAHNIDPPTNTGDKNQKRDDVTGDIQKNGIEILSTYKEIAETPIPSSHLQQTPLREGFNPYIFARSTENRDENVTEGDGASQKCDTVTPPGFEPIDIKKGDGYRDETVTAHNLDLPTDTDDKTQKRDDVTGDIPKNGIEILSTYKEIAESPIPSSPSPINLPESSLPEGVHPDQCASPAEKRDENVTAPSHLQPTPNLENQESNHETDDRS